MEHYKNISDYVEKFSFSDEIGSWKKEDQVLDAKIYTNDFAIDKQKNT